MAIDTEKQTLRSAEKTRANEQFVFHVCEKLNGINAGEFTVDLNDTNYSLVITKENVGTKTKVIVDVINNDNQDASNIEITFVNAMIEHPIKSDVVLKMFEKKKSKVFTRGFMKWEVIMLENSETRKFIYLLNHLLNALSLQNAMQEIEEIEAED